MRKITPLLLFFAAVSLTNKIYGQTCFGNFAGADISLPCGTTCTPFTAQIPEIRSTETYNLTAIPYTPYPYTTAAPSIAYPCPARDDRYTDILPLGFNFCFFAQTHSSFVISTNGLISFDLTNALKGSNWNLQAGSGAQPIPFLGTGSTGTATCASSASGVLYPRSSIMGVYQDIDIDQPATNKKIEFRVEGTAPCRRAIISFNEIANFSGTCPGTSTSMIVIYESTGIVEIYIQDKPACPGGWNDGNAIAGIQDFNGTTGYAPPGRNLGSWGAVGMNEAWQFKPNGTTSLLDHVELVLNGTVVATGTLGALNNGFYDVDFGTVCPPNQNNQYIVRGVYKTCNNDPTFYNIDDTVNIDRIIPFYANGSITKSILCNGDATAEVTFNPIGNTNPYEFSKNAGTTYQTSGVFFKFVCRAKYI